MNKKHGSILDALESAGNGICWMQLLYHALWI